MLEQYPISDFLAWLDEKSLILNAEFQRRNVWPPSAKTYLIDTILKGRPMPNIMIRSLIDIKTKRTKREVIDGQQRLNAISEFATGKLTLGSRAGKYARLSYSDLEEEDKHTFLEYRIGVEQLSNTDNETVLDIFQRLNSYSYRLNPQELRHAGFQGEFRSAVVTSSRRWRVLWEKFGIVTLRQQLRMTDDQLMAEIFGVVLQGVKDGGQPAIERLYKNHDRELPSETETNTKSP